MGAASVARKGVCISVKKMSELHSFKQKGLEATLNVLERSSNKRTLQA